MKGERILATLPEATRGMLHGIMEKMLAISPLLKVAFVPVDAQDAPFSRKHGFRIKYKSSFWYDIAIDGYIVLMKTRGRARKWQGGGCSVCDLREEKKFDEWLRMLLSDVTHNMQSLRRDPLRRGGVINHASAAWDTIEAEDGEWVASGNKVVLRADTI